jgi:hypothetical protein
MIESGICRSYKVDLLRGVHSEDDSYYMALYNDRADLGPTTEVYSSTGEATGNGYQKGGKKVDLRVLPSEYGAVILIDDLTWEAATIMANGCLVYNATKGNRAVAAFHFGKQVSSVNGQFTVELSSGQLIRIV